ncbi:MAG: O-antigen ligase family protein [Parcubacteria group bacterium]
MLHKIKELFTSNEPHQLIKLLAIVLATMAVFSLIGVNLMNVEYVLAVDLIIFILTLFVRFINFGFYALVFFYPFVGWQLFYAKFDAPYVDLVAMLLLAAYLIRLIVGLEKKEKIFSWKNFPGVVFAALFFIASALSLFNTDYTLTMSSLKYLVRPIIFFYVMFVLLPFNLIKDKKTLQNALKIILFDGAIVSLIGILAVSASNVAWYLRRAIPFSFGNFDPLGGNQNAIAEALAVAIPCALILFILAKTIRAKNWYLVSTMIMTLVLILTFSLAGWLALFLEILILFFVKFWHKFEKTTLILIVLALIVIPAAFYFTVWHNLDFLQASNANRIMMTKIAAYSFAQHPIIGNGLNSFQRILGSTFTYTVEFADPLDSHGFVQKILTESGILGFVSFMVLLGYLWKRYLKAYIAAKRLPINSDVILLFIAMFSGIIAFELFSTSYFIAKTWLPIGIGLIGVKLYSEY